MTQVCNRLSQAVRKMWIHITVLYESDVLSHLKFISMFNLVLWKPQPKCWLAERRAWRCGWLMQCNHRAVLVSMCTRPRTELDAGVIIRVKGLRLRRPATSMPPLLFAASLRRD